MRRPGLGLVAVAAATSLVLSACGGGGDDPPSTTGSDPTSSPTDAGPAPGDGDPGAIDGNLHADVEVTATGVVVQWSYRNLEDQPIYVATRAPGPTGSLSDTSAYVVGLADGGVQVAERVFERPEADPNDYYAPFRLGVDKVRAGGTIDGEVSLTTPFTESKPFDGYYADGEAAVPDDPTSVTFCVGVLVPPYSVGTVVDSDDGPLATHGSTDEQTLFCSRPRPI